MVGIMKVWLPLDHRVITMIDWPTIVKSNIWTSDHCWNVIMDRVVVVNTLTLLSLLWMTRIANKSQWPSNNWPPRHKQSLLPNVILNRSPTVVWSTRTTRPHLPEEKQRLPEANTLASIIIRGTGNLCGIFRSIVKPRPHYRRPTKDTGLHGAWWKNKQQS